MTKETKPIIGTDNRGSEIPTAERIKFCEAAVGTMCDFYGVSKSTFDRKLQEGYTRVSYGRGPLGWLDENTAEYIVAFAAFAKEDPDEIETIEVRKGMATFASVSEGLSERKYSRDNYQKTIDRFRLFLITEDLEGFIKRYNWPMEKAI